MRERSCVFCASASNSLGNKAFLGLLFDINSIHSCQGLTLCAFGKYKMIATDVASLFPVVYEAMESYFAENDDEITIKAGDRIEVISKSMDGWWMIR